MAACEISSRKYLEAELWTERDPHVVASSTVEEDVVSDFSPQPDRSCKSLNSCRWIQGEVRGAVAQTDRALEAGGDAVVGDGEIIESDLAGYEEAKGSRTRLELRAEETVQCSQPGVHDSRRDAIAERVRIVPLEVVGHFCFQLDAGPEAEGRAPAEANKVAGRAGIRKPIIVRENTDLPVIHIALLR